MNKMKQSEEQKIYSSVMLVESVEATAFELWGQEKKKGSEIF
jgi:hypothetical protein